MRTKLSTCPPPVWGEVAERVGRRRREWDKPLGPTVEGRTGERPPPRKHLNLPQHARPTRKEKKIINKRRRVSGKKKQKKTLTDFCSISSSIPASSSRLLPFSKHWSLNLLWQQHFCFFSLADLYTLWNTAWKIQKKRKILMIIATTRIYCMWGELYSVISVVVFFEFLFFANAFLFLFLSPLSGICFCFIYPWRFSRSLVDDIYLLRTKRFFLLACLYILSRMPATDTARFAHICMWNKPFVTKVILKGYKWNQGQSGEETWRPYWELTLANQ